MIAYSSPSGSNMRGISRCFSATSKAVFKFSNGLSYNLRNRYLYNYRAKLQRYANDIIFMNQILIFISD